MKTISILKKLINFYFYLLVLMFAFLIIGLPILFKYGKIKSFDLLNEPYNINNLDIVNFLIIILFIAFFFYLFLKAIFLIKKSLKDLSDENYFSELVIKNFNKSGKLILISGIGYTCFKFILRLILINDIKIGVDNSFFLSIIVGLFFMFLSQVFEKGRKTKQENDLTI